MSPMEFIDISSKLVAKLTEKDRNDVIMIALRETKAMFVVEGTGMCFESTLNVDDNQIVVTWYKEHATITMDLKDEAESDD